MIRLRFTKKGKGFDEAWRDLQIKDKTLRTELMALGQQTKIKMKQTIAKSKKRPRAGEPKNLEKAITVEKFTAPGEFGWGVGNIAILDTEAPYWRAVNYGSSHMVGRHLPTGIFRPGKAKPDEGAFRKGRWKAGVATGTGNSYSPIVKKPILPMRFIERTKVWVGRHFRKINAKIRQ